MKRRVREEYMVEIMLGGSSVEKDFVLEEQSFCDL